MPWYYLQSVFGLKTARHVFDAERRYFYYLLAKKKKIFSLAFMGRTFVI
jgi:hypothetical protein